MMRSLSYLSRIWDALRFSVHHPLLLFMAVIALISKANLWAKIALVPLAYFLTGVIGLVIGTIQREKMSRQFLNFLRSYSPDYQFLRFSIETEFTTEEALSITLDPLRGERPGYSRFGKPVGWIVCFRRLRGNRLPPMAFQAFPITGAPFYLILSDRPSEMTPVQIFRVLHEIGHVTLPHLFVREGLYTNILEYVCLSIISFVLTGANTGAMGMVLLAFILWNASFRHPPVVFEELADAYAVLHMVVHPAFQETIQEYKVELAQELKQANRFSAQYIARRLANIDRAAAEARPEGEHPHTRFSVRSQILLPNGVVFLIIGLLLGSIGARVSLLSWPHLIWLIALISCPLFIAWIFVVQKVNRIEALIDDVLLQG